MIFSVVWGGILHAKIFWRALQWWSSQLWKILLLVFKLNDEQTYISIFSLSILQVIMREKKASWWIIFKNHDLSSWSDFQKRHTEVQLVMTIVYLCFNFSVRSSVIFVYLPGKVFNCSSLEQSAYTKKFAPCVFTKEWQRPR